MLERFKSPVTIAAIVAEVVAILLLTGVIDAGVGELVRNVAASVLQVLVLLGVLNNPTDKENF